MGKYSKKNPVNPHKGFKRKVKSGLRDIYREMMPNVLSKEELESKVRDKLGVLMEGAFKEYFEESGYKGNITKLAFNEIGTFFIEATDDLIDQLKVDDDRKKEIKCFFKEYSAYLTEQFNDDAEELAAFIFEDRPINEVNKKIDELSEKLYTHLGELACVILSKVCIIGLIVGAATIATGAGPIALGVGALSSGAIVMLSDSAAVIKMIGSLGGIVKLSAEIIGYKFAKNDVEKLFGKISKEEEGMLSLKDFPTDPFVSNLQILSNTIHETTLGQKAAPQFSK